MEIGHTIAVVNKSGKVVNTSKHIMGVFKEAKLAYQERKAEIKAGRQGKLEERRARLALETMSLVDDDDDKSQSRHSSRNRSRRHHSEHRRGPELRVRPPTERHHSHSSVRTATTRSHSHSSVRSATSRSRSLSGSPRQSSHSIYQHSRSAPASPDRPDLTMVRRHTTQNLDLAPALPQRPSPLRRTSTSAIDMDLAYGEYHAPTLQAQAQYEQSKDLSSLIKRAKGLLDEADCAHASVTAIIQHLQKNPDAMAAVALTLAEISNIASKMAPGALTALKGSAPAVFALLASPQFLIAAGVGVGITVVMFGGYKIIKKIKAKHDLEREREGSMDEALELTSSVDLDRIEHWRRGIADEDVIESGSMVSGTSVEGEIITPIAADMRRSTANLTRSPMAMSAHRKKSSSRTDDRSPSFSSRRKIKTSSITSSITSSSSKKKEKEKEKKKKSDDTKSTTSSPFLLEAGTSSSSHSDDMIHPKIKVKKPSPLRKMFKS